jgi:hypothetical protein
MSEELSKQDQAGTALAALPDFGVAQYAEKDQFDQMVKSSFLPRISLIGGSSNLLKEGKMHVGRYALIRNKEDFVDMGPEFNCIPLIYRFTAMRFDPAKMEAFYDPNSEEFKQIQAESGEQDSGCGYGPEFLLWLPHFKECATYFFSSTSARPEARKVDALIRKYATFKAKLVSNTKNKWHVPVVVPCSVELELPKIEVLTPVVEKFKNPGFSNQSDTEPAPAEAATAGGEPARVR